MESTKSLRFLCLCVLAAAFAGCADTAKATMCETTGVVCPVNFHCAAAQPICLSDTNRCGDAKMDEDANPPEECDDGNNIDGDGCSHICTIEVCGNGRMDPGEQCDDGNTTDGDGCSHNCTIEVCGNGIKDFGEACDDGNTKDGDGCSANCKSTEICGNGIKDEAVGEVCDDGNTVGGDHCSADCRSGEGCGNGIKDPTEECDDGNIDNNDDCRTDCIVNRCGDGVLDLNGSHKEKCETTVVQDHGSKLLTQVESPSCNSDCSLPSCGDGVVNHQFHPIDPITHTAIAGVEQCDDGKTTGNVDDRDCTADCQVNVCGDGHPNTNGSVDRRETCDDGDGIDTNSCTNSCENHRCGDGIVDPAAGEECDDNNQDNNDDCRNDCIVNRCGDGIQNTHGAHHEDCESATPQGTGSHLLTSAESATCNANCTTPSCGDGIVNHQFVTNTTTHTTEQCDDGLTVGNANSKDCTAECQVNVCGDDHPNTAGSLAHREDCDDGNRVDTDACTNDCKAARCGDGILDPANNEECDDHGTANNDGCSSTCKVEFCGDGIVQDSEDCDPGSVGGFSPTCNPDCTLSTCGDGIVNPLFVVAPGKTEQCDDHGTAEGDGCDRLCQFERCGNGILDPGEDCDDGNTLNTDDCTNACKKPACGDGFHKTTGTLFPNEDCDDGNAITEACAYGAASCTVCDATCHNGPGIVTGCGDGVVQLDHEVCDDGNSASCGTCQNTCSRPVAATAATGMIFAGPSGDFTAADTLVVSDGVPGKTPVTLTFVASGGGPPTNVLISGDSFTMAGNITDAINASGLRITATRQGHTGLVALVNHQPSASGNTAITGTFANAATTFLALNFSGGGAGNCGSGTGCRANADCLSNRCTGGSCAACAADAECSTNKCVVTAGQGQCQVCTQDNDCGKTAGNVQRTCNVGTGRCS